jgi:UDPglucose 6-dehydrogenase
MLEEELGGLTGTHIAVWGLAFKAGTDDVRDSIAVRIVNELVARGALVVAYDPAVAEAPPEIRCELRHSAMDAIEQADALLVLTEWDEFAGISPWSIAKRLVRGVVVDPD